MKAIVQNPKATPHTRREREGENNPFLNKNIILLIKGL